MGGSDKRQVQEARQHMGKKILERTVTRKGSCMEDNISGRRCQKANEKRKRERKTG
jgi:hypothetical protein